MKAIRFYVVMPLAFIVLLIEVPCRELRRAWRNLKITNHYHENIRLWVKEWRAGP